MPHVQHGHVAARFAGLHDGLLPLAGEEDRLGVLALVAQDELLDVDVQQLLRVLKHLLPFSEYKIHTFDEIETILLENGLK